MHHGVNEPTIVVESEDDRCVFGEEGIEGHVVHSMRMVVRHHQNTQIHYIDNPYLDARNILLQKPRGCAYLDGGDIACAG